jgi:ABC-type nickel/cobalt efflux system permease component RcnA
MVLLESVFLLHNLGIAWGVGGATISAILMARADKNPESGPHIMGLMSSISKLIWAGLILLIVSGIALVPLITWPMDMTMLLVKHIAVVLLVINGLFLGFRIIPRLQKAVPMDRKPSKEFLSLKKKARSAGTIGLVLWYLILVLSVLV